MKGREGWDGIESEGRFSHEPVSTVLTITHKADSKGFLKFPFVKNSLLLLKKFLKKF